MYALVWILYMDDDTIYVQRCSNGSTSKTNLECFKFHWVQIIKHISSILKSTKMTTPSWIVLLRQWVWCPLLSVLTVLTHSLSLGVQTALAIGSKHFCEWITLVKSLVFKEAFVVLSHDSNRFLNTIFHF